MARIVFYKGQFQYQAGNIFVDQWAQAFRELGHDVLIVDFMSDRWQAQLSQAIDHSTDAVIAFNAIGSDLRFGRVSPYDEFNIRFFPVLLNHPSHQLKRLGHCSYQQPVCTDAGHLDFLTRHGPDECCFDPIFLAHAACVSAEPAGQRSRTLDAIFCGSGVDPEALRSLWKDLPESIRPVIHEIADVCRAEVSGCPDVTGITEVFLSSAGIESGSIQHETVIALLPMIDSYLRAERRLEALRLLDKQRIPVQIFGSGWEFADFRQHRTHEPQDFPVMLDTIASAKVSLDFSPYIVHGCNDRVMSSMGQGTCTITTRNPFIEKHFSPAELIAYDWTERDRLPALVAGMLDSESRREEIATAGQKKAVAEHGWVQRAEEIIRLLDQENPRISAA